MFPWGYCRIPVSRKASVPEPGRWCHPAAPWGHPSAQRRARYGTPIQAQIADSVADADMVCRANAGVIL